MAGASPDRADELSKIRRLARMRKVESVSWPVPGLPEGARAPMARSDAGLPPAVVLAFSLGFAKNAPDDSFGCAFQFGFRANDDADFSRGAPSCRGATNSIDSWLSVSDPVSSNAERVPRRFSAIPSTS